MKKILFLIFGAVTFEACSQNGGAPAFEGKIIYEVNLNGMKVPAGMAAIYSGSETTVYVKGSKYRSDMITGSDTSSTIGDIQSNTSYGLMDMMGKKFKIKPDSAKKDYRSEPLVEYMDETKTIAGYLCKRAELSFTNEYGAHKTTIWYTEDIANCMGDFEANCPFKGIKGMPLEYEIVTIQDEQGRKMKEVAKTIVREPVADSKFETPAGCIETTKENMRKDFIKMMQERK